MDIHESGEMYLKTILILSNKKGSVRSIDIANELNVSKPSVSRAISILKKSELIYVDTNHNIILTESGLSKAADLYYHHVYISKYLMMTLNISQEMADLDACRIEHIISKEVMEKIKEYIIK